MTRRSIAFFSSVIFFALMVASFGFLGLYFDLLLVDDGEEGARGIFMFLASIGTFLYWQLSRRVMHPITRALITAIMVFLVMPIASGIWSLFATGSFAELTISIGKVAMNPLVFITACAAFVASIINELWVNYEQKRRNI